MGDNHYYQPAPLNRVLSIGVGGELTPSDPRDMPGAFDPRFDVDKGALHASTGEIEAAAADELGPPPTTLEEARAACRDAWVDPAVLAKGKAVKEMRGPFSSSTTTTMTDHGTNKAVCVRQLQAGLLRPSDMPSFFADVTTVHQLSHQYGVHHTCVGQPLLCQVARACHRRHASGSIGSRPTLLRPRHRATAWQVTASPAVQADGGAVQTPV